MIPILFDENETQFKTYGIGALSDSLSCLVIEERNGIYELEMEYPINGIHFSEISENKIIFAKPSENKNNQAFRIYKITEPISGVVTIYAEHIRYQLNYIPVSPITAQSCIASLNAIKTNSITSNPFVFHTDKNIEKLYTTGEPKSAGNILGGTEGSILQEFQGEYEFDNWDVYLWTHRGSDTGVTLRYGKNITDFERERDLTNTVTGVLPYWKNEEHLVMGDISEVSSGNAPKKIETIDVTSEFTSETEGYVPTKAEVTQAGYKALQNKSYIGVPSINFKISFVALWQTEEYKDIAPLESVGLCDTVTVVFEPLGIQTKAKVIRTEYDVLLERYNEIEIGDKVTSLSETIAAQSMEIQSAYSRIDKTDSYIALEVVSRRNADDALGSRITLTESAITSEVTNRKNADTALGTRITQTENSITTEVSRAKGAEEQLDTRITTTAEGLAAEISRSTKAEGDLGTRITATAEGLETEVTRATAAEGNLGTRITTTANGLSTEITRATKAEGDLGTRITATAEDLTAEITRSTKAEGDLSSKISLAAHTIGLSVSGSAGQGKSASLTISLYDEKGKLLDSDSGNITLDGNVIFKSNLSDGTTIISGNNIKTGTITSIEINNGNGTFYVDEDGNVTMANIYSSGNVSFIATDTKEGGIYSNANIYALGNITSTSSIRSQSTFYVGASERESLIVPNNSSQTATLKNPLSLSGALSSISNATFDGNITSKSSVRSQSTFYVGASGSEAAIFPSNSSTAATIKNPLTVSGNVTLNYALTVGATGTNGMTVYGPSYLMGYTRVGYGSSYTHGLDIDTINGFVRPSNDRGNITTMFVDLGSSVYPFRNVCGYNAYATISDRKEKVHVQYLDENDELKEFFMLLKPAAFTKKNGDSGRVHYGFYAQDVAESARETVGDIAAYAAQVKTEQTENDILEAQEILSKEGEILSDGKIESASQTLYGTYFDEREPDENLSWSLRYEELIAPIVAMVQSQQIEIAKLRLEVEELKNAK